MIFYFVQIELEHYMLYMHVEKVCICRLLEVLSSQQMLATANRLQICKLQIRKSQQKIVSANRISAKCHICGRSANLLSLQICDFQNLFADCSVVRYLEDYLFELE